MVEERVSQRRHVGKLLFHLRKSFVVIDAWQIHELREVHTSNQNCRRWGWRGGINIMVRMIGEDDYGRGPRIR